MKDAFQEKLESDLAFLRDTLNQANALKIQSPMHSKKRDDYRLIEAALERAQNELEHALSILDPFHGLENDAPTERFYRRGQ